MSFRLSDIRLLFGKDKGSFFCFYGILGFFPHRIALYNQALMHRSIVVRGKNGAYVNNERLEFLGDAVLDAVVADILYRRFKTRSEGFLTSMRSKIVQRETLNHIALNMGLDKLILQSATTAVHHHNYICGNALEALVGAVYLDRGYSYCKKFVLHRVINRYFDLDTLSHTLVNFKSRLIEWCQKNKLDISFNADLLTSQTEGDPVFECRVCIQNQVVGQGVGYSKKEAQQCAARVAYRKTKNAAFLDSLLPEPIENVPTPCESLISHGT